MLARFNRPSPGTLIAMIALVLALGGTAWALPGRDKVDANDLSKGSVTARAIGAGSVGASAIAPGAVGRSEVASASIREAELGSGSVGSGELERISQRVTKVKVAAGKIGDANVSCKDGERLVSGGATVDAGPDAVTPILSSAPSGGASWAARIQNASAQEVSLTAVALCIGS